MMLATLEDADETKCLLTLLDHPLAAPWVAFCALEKGHLDTVDQTRCLALLRALAGRQDLDGMGARIWLADHGYSL